MDRYLSSLNVFFEDPFWVGIFEKVEGKKLYASKVTFGAEPTDAKILDFVLKHYQHLNYSPSVFVSLKAEAKNPKRRQRQLRKYCENVQKGIKSMEAVKLLYLQKKKSAEKRKKDEKEEREKRNYEIKKQKRRQKHRGR